MEDTETRGPIRIDARSHCTSRSLSIDAGGVGSGIVRFSGWIDDLQPDDELIFPQGQGADTYAGVYRVQRLTRLTEQGVYGDAELVAALVE